VRLYDERRERKSRPQVEEPATAQQIQRLYEEQLTTIYRYIYSKVGNREEAEDLTSQVFIKAIRGIDTARQSHSVQSWLFHVARTTVADHWRAFYHIRVQSLDDLLSTGWERGAEETHETVQSTEPEERVKRILSRLPERYQDVLTCRFLLNYSIHETAIKMGLTEANVKVLQFRALRKAAELDGKNG
jgi:RNA polymerase sigma-70 factor, ECF subfamily